MRAASTLAAVILALTVGALGASADLPSSEEHFATQYPSYEDPAIVAEAFLAAVLVGTEGDRGLGEDLLDLVMASPEWEKGQPALATTIEESPWVFRSYSQNSDPDDGYAMDPVTWSASVSRVTNIETDVLGQGELALVYLETAAGAPRPLILRKTEDGWKVASATPLLFGLASPDGNPGEDIAATSKPEGLLHLWFEATYLYLMGIKDEGRLMLDALLTSKGHPEDIDKMLAKGKEMPWIFYSYAEGTSVDDTYSSLDPFFFTIEITRDDKFGDWRRAYVSSTGAATPRPFQYVPNKRDQGRMLEFSSLRSEVRPPEKEDW